MSRPGRNEQMRLWLVYREQVRHCFTLLDAHIRIYISGMISLVGSLTGIAHLRLDTRANERLRVSFMSIFQFQPTSHLSRDRLLQIKGLAGIHSASAIVVAEPVFVVEPLADVEAHEFLVLGLS